MDISKGSRIVENIKSILLVVLFLSTILLLYFFWGYEPLRTLMGEESPRHAAMEPVEIFQPNRIEISFGGGDYTIIDTNNFEEIMNAFKIFSEDRNLFVEEISNEWYHHEVNMRPSIKAVFEYYIPFSAICELYGIDRIHGADAIDAVTELAYVVGFDDSLFVYDTKSGRHFRIVGRSNNSFNNLVEIIENAQENYVPHHTVSHFMGGAINNSTLFPFSFESNLHDIEFSREDFSRHPDRVTDIIRSFFSDNFDFVRRIAEANGTVIYMYGFGRIVVVAHHNGILEYRREEDAVAAPLGYLEAFERANAFIAAHGGFSTIDGISLTPYIKNVIADPGGRGYRFVFGVKVAGGRVYYRSGAPIIVDVIGDSVSYFRRQLINPLNVRQNNEYREAFLPIINMIAINIEYIQAALIATQGAEPEALNIETILEKVTRLDSGYVKMDENENTLKAAWIVTIDGLEFYFGLDNGEPLWTGQEQRQY